MKSDVIQVQQIPAVNPGDPPFYSSVMKVRGHVGSQCHVCGFVFPRDVTCAGLYSHAMSRVRVTPCHVCGSLRYTSRN